MQKTSNIKHLLLLLTLALTSLSAAAVDITGRIVDESGEPLIQASVRLLTPKDSTQVKSSVTDINGRYTLSAVKKGNYILEASYVGYNNAYQNVTVADANINLKPVTLR